MKIRKCYKCKIEKSIDNFWRDGNYKRGYHYECIDCVKSWRKQNRESLSNYQKKYYLRKKTELAKIKKKYYLDHREDLRKYSKECLLKKKKEQVVMVPFNGLGQRLYKCSECKQYKAQEDFIKNKTIARGFSYQCKDCRKIYDEKRRQQKKMEAI